MFTHAPSLIRFLPWMVLLGVWLNSAWVCDDAYITFRTVDHVVQGHGPVFNVGERVQAYTHPLWMWLHVPFHAVFGNIYFVTLALSLVCSLWAFALLARDREQGWFLLPLVLLSSKALMEYSSSGLENPLTYLLVAWFAVTWMNREPKSLGKLSLIACLLFLNRVDALILVLPALSLAWWEQRSWRNTGVVLLGFLPAIAWEAFSVTYYGFLFPNTAYAKLGTGISRPELWSMGWAYFKDVFFRDPVVLPIIGASLAFSFMRRRYLPIMAGVVLYLIYCLQIGGDFMSGRFFAAPLLLSLFVFARWMDDFPKLRELAVISALAVSFLGPTPMLTGGLITGGKDKIINADGVADERSFYYPGTGLKHVLEGRDMPDFRWVADGKKAKAEGKRVVVTEAIGFFSYFASAEVHVVDRLALSDPFLARIPAMYKPHPRPGHYGRHLPAGYVQTLEKGENLLRDSSAACLFEDIKVITRGALFSRSRWSLIWKYNFQEPAPASMKRYRVPVADEVVQLPSEKDSFESRDGFGYEFSWSGGDTLRFHLDGVKECVVAWLKEGLPFGGETCTGAGSKSVAIPAGVRNAAIFPVQNWPIMKLGRVQVE